MHIEKIMKWSFFSNYVDGWISKFAFFVPIIGYMILFNNELVEIFNLSTLLECNTQNQVNCEINNQSQSDISRLQFVYFGLIFLGVSNIIYHIFKPKAFKISNLKGKYVQENFSTFTHANFKEVYLNYLLRTQAGLKKEDAAQHKKNREFIADQWHSFSKARKDSQDYKVGHEEDRKKSWPGLKNKYEDFLATLLQFDFEHQDTKLKFILGICVILSSIGYMCLAYPSILVFMDVAKITFPYQS